MLAAPGKRPVPRVEESDVRLNADFSKRAAVIPANDAWIRSPESGVDRLLLDRIGDEVARATSIVRYAPGSSFPSHEHAKGEEFLVLDGVFSDETGDYPAGCYVRNPPGSSHAPFSEAGCRILVKLRQFDPADLEQFAVDTRDARAWTETGRARLHEYGTERVHMRRLAAGEALQIDPGDAGTETFVVAGRLSFDERTFPAESWLRFPPGDAASLTARQPSTVWVKTGHLG